MELGLPNDPSPYRAISINSYQYQLETADAAKRAQSMAAHAAKLKGTIKALADRDCPRQFPKALDYVMLFLPAESLFSAALEGDRDLIMWAAEKGICWRRRRR